MFKSYEKRLDRLKNYARKYIFSLWFYDKERKEKEKKNHEGR